MAPKSSVSSMFYALPLLVSLAHGHQNNKHSHGADASAVVPVSQYLNSFSIEFKNLPDFAGMSIPSRFILDIFPYTYTQEMYPPPTNIQSISFPILQT